MFNVVLARPWWVNLLLLIPVGVYFLSDGSKITMARRHLVWIAMFGIAFAFVEAAVVVYLRTAAGLMSGPPASAVLSFPGKLLTIERYREAATIVMLIVIGLLAGQRKRERFVAFMWAFAFWDLFYYLWLRVTIGWPASLMDTDLLFLLPVPWVAQVWFPVLVSGLTIVAVCWQAKRTG